MGEPPSLHDVLDRRRRDARYALLVFIGALDDTPLHDVGSWLMELGESLICGTPIPGAEDASKALHGELPDRRT